MNVVSSKIKLNVPKINQLSKATVTALEQTVTALHTEVVNAQVMPFGKNRVVNGKMIHQGGNLQNDNTYEDFSDSKRGKVKLISSTPYARRMYFHPEYNFNKSENPNAQGNWLEAWISGKNKNFCKKAFSQFYKKEAGLK